VPPPPRRRRAALFAPCTSYAAHAGTAAHHLLPLHDALPICGSIARLYRDWEAARGGATAAFTPRERDILRYLKQDLTNGEIAQRDRKSTRLNSSHVSISYAVFCLKKQKQRPFPLRRLDPDTT